VGEEGEVPPGHLDGLGLVEDGDVDHPVRGLGRQRADDIGRDDPEAAALDHGGPAHPDVRARGGDDHIAHAEQGGVAGEAAARRDAHQRDRAAQAGEQVEGHRVETRHARRVGVAGSTAASLGEQDHGQAGGLGQLEQAVLLAEVLHALGAGEDGVVVGHHDHRSALDASDPADEPVGRRALDEVLHRAPSPLGRDHQRPVLDEAARIAQVGDVLASGALAGPAPLRDGVGAVLVEPDRVPVDDLGERARHDVQVDRGGARRGGPG
jgi:hypothetical protein